MQFNLTNSLYKRQHN